ncbi:hypothetical protein [Pedobacter sp. ASV28]|nr:hypothetical protein [Pedobacter sp. ASV28]
MTKNPVRSNCTKETRAIGGPAGYQLPIFAERFLPTVAVTLLSFQ